MSRFVSVTSNKKRGIALLLCVFLGMFGAHRFYVGKVGSGLIYCFTGGFFFFGIVIDFFKILGGSFRDNTGIPLREW